MQHKPPRSIRLARYGATRQPGREETMKQTLIRVSISLFACAWIVTGQAPSNDLCQNATAVFDGVNPGAPLGASGSFFSNVGAAAEGSASCIPAGYGSSSDVWFSYTATASGIAIFSTCTPAG